MDKLFGVLPVNKPSGWTSRDVVNKIQSRIRPAKAGHTGTLDPLASGVLLVAIGSATKLVEFSHADSKAYTATFQFGQSSDTLDCEGNIASMPAGRAADLSEAQLRDVLSQWVGRIPQVPPRFSAINIKGKRAHELARQGVDFELPSRTVTIYSLELQEFAYPYWTVHIECSTGTYVRTLGSDIAKSLQTDAIMTELTRTRVGTIDLVHCHPLDALDSRTAIASALLPPQSLLASLDQCVLTSHGCERIRHGKQLSQGDFLDPPQSSKPEETERWAATDPDGTLVAILTRATPRPGPDAEAQPTHARFRSLRVFQNTKDAAQPTATSKPHKPES